MHPFQQEVTNIVSVLDEAYKQIEAIETPGFQHVKNKVLMTIQRESGALKMQIGIDITNNTPKPKAAPLKKMFGKVIGEVKHAPADVNKPVNDTPNEVALKELRMRVDELWPKFLSTSADHILDSVSDIEIRGVAKKAGLPVTEDNPKRITTEFIEQIIAAIQKQIEPETPNLGTGDNPDEDLDIDVDSPDNKAPILEPLKTQEEIALDQFRATVDKLYSEFNKIENKAIIDSYADIEIRGVAKKAGLPVTEDNPKKVDNKFLDQVKAAIKKKADLEKIAQ